MTDDEWAAGCDQVVDPGDPKPRRRPRPELTEDERIERDHRWVQHLYESPRGLTADY